MSEQVDSNLVGSADSRVALDPGTAPELLAGIAQTRPELRVFVAMNPAADAGLVQWLARLGDPAVDAALAIRAPIASGPSSVPPPPPARGVSSGSLPAEVTPSAVSCRRRRGMLIAGVLVAVPVLAGGFAGYRLLTAGDTRGPAPLEIRTQLTLTPAATGKGQITSATIAEAIRIIRGRLDSSGVAGADITSQGESNIVVVLSGKPDHATLGLIRKKGQMRFRAVLIEGSVAPAPVPTSISTPTAAPAPASAATPQAGKPQNASDLAWITPDVEAAYTALDCANPKDVEAIVDDPAKPMVTCSVDGRAKYILGPAEVLGSEVSNATSGQQQTSGGSTGIWEVRLDFNVAGTKAFGDVTSRLVVLAPPRNQFAIVLDNQVISAPVTQAALTAGNASITGSFTREAAAEMATLLRIGALPLTFQVHSEQISTPLGAR